ncbi:meiosis regulator and mRNA stability factor 1-like [Brevipalpus obovatus]|uniref:meiosis regulator and mRNA stability factor 1-like n=1 Tax=Brevipalpus obovatus TaxID=246614 RepID=UPI003D9F9057
MMANQSKNCGVFWDIENVGLPKRMKPREFREMIESRLINMNIEEFYCVTDTVKMNNNGIPGFLASLELAGTVIHVSSTSKNASDEKLIDLMNKYVDKGGQSLVLISGDVNYINHLRRFRAKGCRIYLIASNFKSTSKDLITAAHEAYFLDRSSDKIKLNPLSASDPNLVEASSKNNPSFVRVIGLPLHRQNSQFHQLLFSTGGKVRTDIKDGQYVWLSFRCRDDALRAANKLDGWKHDNHDNHVIRSKLFEDLPPEIRPKQDSKKENVVSLASLPHRVEKIGHSNPPKIVQVKSTGINHGKIEKSIKNILSSLKGTLRQSGGSCSLVHFTLESDAIKFCDEMNAIFQKLESGSCEAKILPLVSRQELTNGSSNSTKGASANKPTSQEKKDSGPLYLSLVYENRPGDDLIRQLDTYGIQLQREKGNCLWFIVENTKRGQKAMDKLNSSGHGFKCTWTRELPKDLKNNLGGVRVWEFDSKTTSSLSPPCGLPSGVKVKSIDQLI